MKRTILSALLLAGVLFGGIAPLAAEPADAAADKAASPVKKKGKKDKKNHAAKAEEEIPEELSPVAAALKGLTYCSDARPSLTAKYYIYLFSSSTCTFCNKTMPADVEQHKQMRRQGETELVMINVMDKEEAAAAFLAKYDAKFAAVCFNALRNTRLPGLGMPHGIPFVAIVDCNGNLLHSGPGSGPNTVEEWKKYTIGEDAVIPPPTPAELKAEAKAKKEAERAAAKAEKEKARAEKRNKGKKKNVNANARMG